MSSGNLSVNGQRETANAFLVNGGDVSEGRNLGCGPHPELDSVEEFRLITNSFDAEYGKFSGAVMNAITKSGTNSIHGTVFEFLRNDKFDAAIISIQPSPNCAATSLATPSAGRSGKTSFLVHGLPRHAPGAWARDRVSSQVPNVGPAEWHLSARVIFSMAERRSADRCQGSVLGATLQHSSYRLGYTVTDGEPYYVAGCTSQFQCVFPNAIIPATAFAAPAVGILPYIPVPNVPGTADQFSDNSQRNSVRDDKVGQRVDFINQKTGNWSFYYHFDDSTVENALNASVPGFRASRRPALSSS